MLTQAHFERQFTLILIETDEYIRGYSDITVFFRRYLQIFWIDLSMLDSSLDFMAM